MSISSISAGTNPAYQTDLSSLYKQRKQDLKAIEDAVQSSDLASAQQAVALFQQDQQTMQHARAASGGQGQTSQHNSPFKHELSALIGAIQSGDLVGAQIAVKTLDQDRQSRVGAAAGQGPGNFKQDLQSLFQAVQSGDLSGAQQSLSAVQTDLKAAGTGHHHHHGGGKDGDADDKGQRSVASGGITGSSTSPGASVESTTSIQTLLTNVVNSAAQAAYASLTSTPTPASLLNTQV